LNERWLKANSEELQKKLYEEMIKSISAEELTKLEVSKNTWKSKLSTPECYNFSLLISASNPMIEANISVIWLLLFPFKFGHFYK
jgi:hypothetical protein